MLQKVTFVVQVPGWPLPEAPTTVRTLTNTLSAPAPIVFSSNYLYLLLLLILPFHCSARPATAHHSVREVNGPRAGARGR
ncbi:hypothetical protein GUITHDRAFT_69387 [Guillardia theta CCMP2712]|uniref:Uncharacterized protein n=1 Tax=Guillardia theta (strain CCMP2712) TaxID=905079 RepID=L1JHH4_GUITC|nr:hypothetical protein GUITHDRAFT_69387 [Guillardia theta CCMP2712]EKX47550.1 hypothetical protein GUITHDRAFT_69387 [Guillardia theta CCMP2712]|eukprot:XP_005834530.1 hypothetical protein GUITHDRAFT_69387 [Guillardia theta CCMP2712]